MGKSDNSDHAPLTPSAPHPTPPFFTKNLSCLWSKQRLRLIPLLAGRKTGEELAHSTTCLLDFYNIKRRFNQYIGKSNGWDDSLFVTVPRFAHFDALTSDT